MAYFQIMQGLRGCYLPDNSYIIRADTRRELKRTIEIDVDNCMDGNIVGLSMRDVAWVAAHAWHKGSKGAILPYGYKGKGKPYSIEICRSNRADYLEYLASEGF